MTPHLTIYTDRFIPTRFAAISAGPLILVRPAYRGDAGLLAHEMLHAKQWLLTTLAMLIVAGIVYALQRPEWAYVAIAAPAVFGAIYKLFPAARLRIEAAAYRLQLTYYPDDRSALFASFLATKYGLGITQDQALQALHT